MNEDRLPARVLYNGIVIIDVRLFDREEVHLIVPCPRLKKRAGIEAGEGKTQSAVIRACIHTIDRLVDGVTQQLSPDQRKVSVILEAELNLPFAQYIAAHLVLIAYGGGIGGLDAPQPCPGPDH